MVKQQIEKILVIGSGPIIIGQAAEFDYSGTQACQTLKEEGYTVILVNSNPATIMTDKTIADKIYMEPLTVDFLTKIIRKERPDALLPTMGGQTALNLAAELDKLGILKDHDIQLLGTSLETIQQAEDREKFRSLMDVLKEPVPASEIVHSIEEALDFVQQREYPVIVRPAFTLGGTGGGMCYNKEELIEVVHNGLSLSPVHQCLIEESIAGFKEIELEILRDRKDQAIVVCSIENIDPVGIHTGDSIVVAPSQTLRDYEYHHLRDVALKIVRALKIEGSCNVQMALDPESFRYYIIEVNPRVSRSSALASKATGYPIAKIATQIAVGKTLDEIINPLTNMTYASFEPILDYVVIKFPRFPFDKFTSGDRTLGTQMKATGEVMAMGRTFEQSFLKAFRSLSLTVHFLSLPKFKRMRTEELIKALQRADDERIFALSEAFRRGMTIEEANDYTKIDLFFLRKIKNIISFEQYLKSCKRDLPTLRRAKKLGFSDAYIANLWGLSKEEVYKIRKKHNLFPTYKVVDTSAGLLPVKPRYFYSTYEEENESIVSDRKKVIVIGSGPIQIGQGIEFDYATVHSIFALKELGYEAIIVNNNPETVSTDFSISDKLYFEPITVEDVMNIIEREQPEGVIVQMGGQTAINLAADLEKRGVKILGTSLSAIAQVENRDKFENLLKELKLNSPEGKAVIHDKDVIPTAKKLGYPVLIRPSYVIGGSRMEIIHNEQELQNYLQKVKDVNDRHPFLVDKYITGIEVDVDAISDGETVLIPGIMEHIEGAGVHSGDSIAMYPPQRMSVQAKEKCVQAAIKIAKQLNIRGHLNIQFIIQGDEVFVIEVNPRASRTIPFLSKIMQIPMANLATKCMLGISLRKMGYQTGCLPEKEQVYVKVPVFSFEKLRSVDTTLGPEMKSTGEAIGYDSTLEKALYKGLLASGISVPLEGSVLFTIADQDKETALEQARRFHNLGFELYATRGTANFFERENLPVKRIAKIGAKTPNVLSIIKKGQVQLVINTITSGKKTRTEGFRIRRESVEHGIGCLTNLDTAEALLKVIESTTFSAKEFL